MKLLEALEILRAQPPSGSDDFSMGVVCGFNPLHLQTLLGAHLRLLFPGRSTGIQSGLYGDFWGNLGKLTESRFDVGVLFFEWPDLDARLGIRGLGSWKPDGFSDILKNSRVWLHRLEEKVQKISSSLPLVICPPTLPSPPIDFRPGWQRSALQLELEGAVCDSLARLAQDAGVRVVNADRLNRVSPPSERLDIRSEIETGFPYTLSHASALSDLVTLFIKNSPAKKGLITDLDGTLWSGVLGEVGVEGVSWGLGRPGHMHGLYQRLLEALSAEGILVGVASKNDPSVVDEVLCSQDFLLSPSSMFPVVATWGPKSAAVSRILATWNISPDSVVFIDDTAAELAEVKEKHPDLECLRFPTGDIKAIYDLLSYLRDLFGKNILVDEDKFRLESVRSASVAREELGETGASTDDFFTRVDAEIQFTWVKGSLDKRASDLVNKTNQFNLNGARRSELYWREYLKNPLAFCFVAAYRDKYGPLGKIAVLAGCQGRNRLSIDTWVMSCRAFSRRIEYKCLEALFSKFEADEIEFDFVGTARNGPLREFLTEILETNPGPGSRISRHRFFACRPESTDRIQEVING